MHTINTRFSEEVACRKENNIHPAENYIILTIVTTLEWHKLLLHSFLSPTCLCV